MKDVYILAIESSCDETSVSIIMNGFEDVATIINSQIDVHTKYGGVVPEVASRLHLENITMVIDHYSIILYLYCVIFLKNKKNWQCMILIAYS